MRKINELNTDLTNLENECSEFHDKQIHLSDEIDKYKQEIGNLKIEKEDLQKQFQSEKDPGGL